MADPMPRLGRLTLSLVSALTCLVPMADAATALRALPAASGAFPAALGPAALARPVADLPPASPAAVAAPGVVAAPQAVEAARFQALAAPALVAVSQRDASAGDLHDAGRALEAVLQGGVGEAAATKTETLAFPADSRLAGVTVREPVSGVIHLNFPSQYLMTSTFLRFQEHYESPKFSGKAFTLEDFMDWYAVAQGKGEFTYFKDWGGFNIPSRILKRFYKGDFNPLTEKEKDFLKLFVGRTGAFYIIGTSGETDDGTLRHEIAHGLYSSRPAYRRAARAILSGLNLEPLYALFRKMGYAEHVLHDEAHAYLGDELKDLGKKGIKIDPYVDAHKRLLALYRKHAAQAPRP